MALYARDLTEEEGLRLQAIIRKSRDAIRSRRAMVILSSAQGYKVPEIARRYYLTPEYVRVLIHQFNQEGIRSLDPKFNGPKHRGGGSRTFTEEEKAAIIEVARMPPQLLGYPFRRWSLRTLRLALLEKGRVERISEEALRQILHSRGITFQRTRTWKTSRDPHFRSKKNRVQQLVKNHAHHPQEGVVLSTDEFGPLALRPELGANWTPQGKPDRVPATYKRGGGGQHLLAALDLTHDKLYGWTIPRKKGWRFLAFLKYFRRKFPRQRLYVILDNHSTHITRKIREWAKAHHVELAYTPTNASWLNPIEPHFVPLKELVLRNVYYRDKKEQAQDVRRYIMWRNRHRDDPRLKALEKRKKVD